MSQRLVLGIDTTDRGAHAAVATTHGVRATRSATGQRSVEQLVALVEECLQEASLGLGQLTHIAVTIGPGSFTGIRGGISCAQGLAAGLNIPVIGVSALLAHATLIENPAQCAVVSRKASSADVFCSAMLREGQGEGLRPLGAVIVATIEQAASLALSTADSLGTPVEVLDLALLDGNCLAVGCAQLVAQERLSCSVSDAFGHYQLSDRGIGLMPAYGKGVVAKTLAERGLLR